MDIHFQTFLNQHAKRLWLTPYIAEAKTEAELLRTYAEYFAEQQTPPVALPANARYIWNNFIADWILVVERKLNRKTERSTLKANARRALEMPVVQPVLSGASVRALHAKSAEVTASLSYADTEDRTSTFAVDLLRRLRSRRSDHTCIWFNESAACIDRAVKYRNRVYGYFCSSHRSREYCKATRSLFYEQIEKERADFARLSNRLACEDDLSDEDDVFNNVHVPAPADDDDFEIEIDMGAMHPSA